MQHEVITALMSVSASIRSALVTLRGVGPAGLSKGQRWLVRQACLMLEEIDGLMGDFADRFVARADDNDDDWDDEEELRVSLRP